MDFEKLKQEAFETAKAHGWHDKELSDETYLLLIITEALDVIKLERFPVDDDCYSFLVHADRQSFECELANNTVTFEKGYQFIIKDRVEDRIAGIIIRCFEFAEMKGINLDYAKRVLDMEMPQNTETLPELMLDLCTCITDNEVTLKTRLNTIVSVVIRYFQQRNIDIEYFINLKMKYNKLYGNKNGDKKY